MRAELGAARQRMHGPQSHSWQARSCRWASLVGLLLILCLAMRAQATETALLVDINGPIGPAVESYTVRAFDEARLRQAAVVVLRIDTPGGLDTSTRGIIRAILSSERPVIGFVAPSSARAASAGAYILVACHVAAMAAGTNVGSATPITLGGLPPGQPSPLDEDKPDHPTLEDKLINDARAYMRALARMRGRPADVAERFVSEAMNLTASEALEQGLIDVTADSLRTLLTKIDGFEVSIDGEPIVLQTALLDVERFELTWRDRFLAFITNPNIAYLLLMVGIYGLIIEASNPGLIVPGIAGATALILGLYALQLLPVNFAGLALVVLGLSLMVAEAFVPAFGALGIGGIVCLFLGSIMLFDMDVPGFRLSPVLAGTVSLVTGGLFLIVLSLAVRAWRRPAASGVEALVGRSGRVIRWDNGRGDVLAHGEVWAAVGTTELETGADVVIEKVDGLTLHVAPTSSEPMKED